MMKNSTSVVVSYTLKFFAFVLTSFTLVPVAGSQATPSPDLTRHSTSKAITTSSQPATCSTTHVFPGLSTDIRRGNFFVSYLLKVVTFVKRSCSFVPAVDTPATSTPQIMPTPSTVDASMPTALVKESRWRGRWKSFVQGTLTKKNLNFVVHHMSQVVTFVIPSSTLAPAVNSRVTSSPDHTHSVITETTLPSSTENGRHAGGWKKFVRAIEKKLMTPHCRQKGTEAGVSTHRDRSTFTKMRFHAGVSIKFQPIFSFASNFTKMRAIVVTFVKRSCGFVPAVDTPATSSTNHSDEVMPTPCAFYNSNPATLSKENRSRWKRFVQGTTKKSLNFVVQQMSKVVTFVMASCTLVPAGDSRVTSSPDHTNSVITKKTMPPSTMETCKPATPTESVRHSGRWKIIVRAIKTKLMTPACRKKGADAGIFMQRDHSSSVFPIFSPASCLPSNFKSCLFVPPSQARKTTFGRTLKNKSTKLGRRLAQAWPKKVEGNPFSPITAKRLKKLNRMAHTPPQLIEEEIDPIMIREIESQRSSCSSPFSLPSFRNMKCTLGDLFQHEMAGTKSQCSSRSSSFSFTSIESEYIAQSPERMMIHQHGSSDNNDCFTSNQQFNSDFSLDVPPRLSQLWSDDDTGNVDDRIGDEEMVSNYQTEEKNQELSFAAKMYFQECELAKTEFLKLKDEAQVLKRDFHLFITSLNEYE